MSILVFVSTYNGGIRDSVGHFSVFDLSVTVG